MVHVPRRTAESGSTFQVEQLLTGQVHPLWKSHFVTQLASSLLQEVLEHGPTVTINPTFPYMVLGTSGLDVNWQYRCKNVYQYGSYEQNLPLMPGFVLSIHIHIEQHSCDISCSLHSY